MEKYQGKYNNNTACTHPCPLLPPPPKKKNLAVKYGGLRERHWQRKMRVIGYSVRLEIIKDKPKALGPCHHHLHILFPLR